MAETIQQWSTDWNILPAALEDLRRRMCCEDHPAPQVPGESEAAVQTRVRLEASRKGIRLWRNNVGATKTDTGSFIRYGLANETTAMNKLLKSSDLIGIRPVVITPGHVGHTIGQFMACEVKHAGWKYTGGGREKAQMNYLELVTGLGGDARFVNTEGTL